MNLGGGTHQLKPSGLVGIPVFILQWLLSLLVLTKK